MMASIRAEFRKLFTIRSTYVVTAIVIAVILLMSFYLEGYRGNTGSAASELLPTAMQEIAYNTLGMAALFISIIAILAVGHEYRYNTIVYTLTANARRTQVYLAKALAVTVFGIGFALLALAFSFAVYHLGLLLRDATLSAQQFDVWTVLGRAVLYSGVYAMVGFVLAVLLRSIIGAIAVLLLFPSTIEPLLGLLLKDNAQYLPFSTFDHIVGAALMPGTMTANTAAALSAVYIAVLGIVAWLSFIKRDAN